MPIDDEDFQIEISDDRKLQLFTDRHEFTRRFAFYLNEDPPREQILYFFGDGGNGKSLLLKHLQYHCCKKFAPQVWQQLRALPESRATVVGCVALEKSLDVIENLIATHRENRTHKTNNTYFVGLLFATGIRCVRIGVCKTIRFCRLTHPTPLSAPMICYAPIASQFLTFAITNNLSELNNKTNYFCLPNLG